MRFQQFNDHALTPGFTSGMVTLGAKIPLASNSSATSTALLSSPISTGIIGLPSAVFHCSEKCV